MRHAITSILRAIGSARVAAAGGKESATAQQTVPMLVLSIAELRQIAGGDDNLPKGGW